MENAAEAFVDGCLRLRGNASGRGAFLVGQKLRGGKMGDEPRFLKC